MFPRSGYFFYAAPPVRFERRIGLSGGISVVFSIVLSFLLWCDKGINIFLIICKYLACFFMFFLTHEK